MIVKNIELKNFRNYNELHGEFNPRVNVILGENAQGKTNLLEAIYFTSMGQSFRTPKNKDLIMFNKEYCRVSLGYYRKDEGIISIAVDRQGKRLGKINGVKIEKRSQLVDKVLTVIFSPEDLKIVKEDPEKRRKFIDNELCQLKLSYYRDLNRYNKILVRRNKYLKEETVDESLLNVWNESLCMYGREIIKARGEFIEKLDGISRKIHGGITKGKETLKIKYVPNLSKEEDFFSVLEESLETDRLRGNTSRGPHKDDFEIFIDDVNVRYFGSQGQQRTAALSVKLAEIRFIEEEKKESPVLLLDDVFSELDSSRQRDLINYLEGTQIFITGTYIPKSVLSSFPEGKTFLIKAGEVKDK